MAHPEHVEHGPYLQAAFFCERLLEESDGVLSAIRIVDTITTQDDESTPHPVMRPVNLTLFIAFKAGQARGAYDLTVAMEGPTERSSTHPAERHTQTILFDGADHGGATIIMPVALIADQEGVYWFSVFLDDLVVTRLPLRVVSARRILSAHPQ